MIKGIPPLASVSTATELCQQLTSHVGVLRECRVKTNSQWAETKRYCKWNTESKEGNH